MLDLQFLVSQTICAPSDTSSRVAVSASAANENYFNDPEGSEIGQLASRVVILEGKAREGMENLTNVANDVSALKTDVSALKTGASALTTDLGSIKRTLENTRLR